MPQKLTTSDYTFYFIPDGQGRYIWKDAKGHIFRIPNDEYDKLAERLSKTDSEIEILFGIADVEVAKTGEHTLVFDLFKDLRDKEEEDDRD